jgi:hypothetical protein
MDQKARGAVICSGEGLFALADYRARQGAAIKLGFGILAGERRIELWHKMALSQASTMELCWIFIQMTAVQLVEGVGRQAYSSGARLVHRRLHYWGQDLGARVGELVKPG